MRRYLEDLSLFTSREIEEFLSLGKTTTLKKGDYFIREGEIANRLAFVNSGLLRTFYYSMNSDEVTYCFSFPNDWITGYSSFITQQETNENIEALEDCELIEFPKAIVDNLVASHLNWLLFSKQMAESQYVKLERRIFMLQKENALNRYKELMENHPEYLNLIPLGYLASYLGISQRHLSRIRKQISF